MSNSDSDDMTRRYLRGLRKRKRDELAKTLYDSIIDHDRIRRVSERHFNQGEYRIAVLDSLIALEEMVKEKAEYPKVRGKELSGTSLMRHVFDVNNPILSWMPLNTQAERDELEGYQNIMAGAILGIRNPKAHKIFQQTPMRALQLLVLVELLAELVDVSKNIKREQREKESRVETRGRYVR